MYGIKYCFSHTRVYNEIERFKMFSVVSKTLSPLHQIECPRGGDLFIWRKIMEKVFVDGLMAKKPRDQAPDWVKCNISIKRESLIAWLSAENKEWINVQVCESKGGKWYAEVDTWEPTPRNNPAPSPSTPPARGTGLGPSDGGEFGKDDIPF
jgi:hypothetical protein